MNPRTRRGLLAAALLAATAIPAFAVKPNERLADPVLEARARKLSEQLRCLVCQNETIDESDADLARDIRLFLRERLTAGDSDAKAMQSIVDRYGNFVLLKPPLEPVTYLLWFGPVAILVAGCIGAFGFMRRRQAGRPAPADLNADEQHQLDTLLRENDK